MKMGVHISLPDPRSVLWGICPEEGLLNPVVVLLLFLRGLRAGFDSVHAILRGRQQCTRVTVSVSPRPRQPLFSGSLTAAALLGGRRCLSVGVSGVSLTISPVEHVFLCLLAICVSSLGECLFKSFTHFLIDT